MSLESAIIASAINKDNLSPQITTSKNYKHWVSIEDWRRCTICEENHGKIWLVSETPDLHPPIHLYGRCTIKLMQTITAGTATINGVDGADWVLKYHGILPDYYITKEDALAKGWKPRKWLSNFAPNKLITGGRYYNDNGHLPSALGRVWYEADINYKTGRRNSQRVLWSNDGLIFVTYDHYKTFYEIV